MRAARLVGMLGGITSADAYIAAVLATGATVPAGFKTAVAAALDDPAFARVTDFALFAGPSTLAGALIPVRSSTPVSVWPSTNLVSTDYIATGADCGINAYQYIGYGSISGGPTPKSLATGAVAAPQASGVFVVGGRGTNDVSYVFTKGGSYPTLYWQSVTQLNATSYGFGGGQLLQPLGRSVGDFIALRQGQSAFRVYQNGVQTADTTADGGAGNVPTAGAYNLMSGGAGYEFGSRYTAFAAISSATYAESLAIRTRIMNILSVAGYATGLSTYFTTGDSIAAGFGATSWSEVVRANRTGRHINAGFAGRLATGAGGTIAVYPQQAKEIRPDSAYSTAGWYLPLVGTNDLGASTTGAALYTAMQAHWAVAVADGYKVGKFTVLPRADAPWTGAMETQRLAYNTAVRGDATAGTTLIDIAGIAAMSNPSDGVNYQADKLHPSNAGNIVLGNFISPLLI